MLDSFGAYAVIFGTHDFTTAFTNLSSSCFPLVCFPVLSYSTSPYFDDIYWALAFSLSRFSHYHEATPNPCFCNVARNKQYLSRSHKSHPPGPNQLGRKCKAWVGGPTLKDW